MTADLLQRVAVRMLHDPNFCAAVYADPERALADVALDAQARSWLVAPDIRRWRADPERSHRVLDALMREYPVACARRVAVLLRAAGRETDPALAAGDLLGFFADAHFHRSIMDRGWLFEAFGHWLAQGVPEVAEAARLERAVASARRGWLEPNVALLEAEAGWRPAPGVVGVVLPAGAFARHSAHREALQADPRPLALTVLDPPPAVRTPPAPIAGLETEGLLVEPGLHGPRLGEVSPELATMFAACAAGAKAATWARLLQESGAELHEINEIIDEWRADGLVVSIEK